MYVGHLTNNFNKDKPTDVAFYFRFLRVKVKNELEGSEKIRADRLMTYGLGVQGPKRSF